MTLTAESTTAELTLQSGHDALDDALGLPRVGRRVARERI
ncbi:hypothetical protein PR003_g6963 [Phytophthora rubi]|uniref:Uncharacterized protein n=1 Tax=Phytophthora rubi TaxID=129364 RepID=A0A6A4FFB1_9STRA|nr:hypothetical protein PR003_g6963 [Phytophthora rubi]